MAEIMQKLSTMGRASQQQGPSNSRSKYGGAQVVNVTYGHNGSGKLYSYYGTNKRVGDIVTPEVTHPKSGKTYKTLAVVRSTHNAGQGTGALDYLQGKQPNAQGNYIGKPTGMKWIGKTDQRSLRGYQQYKDNGGAKKWAEDAKAVYDLRKETLLRDDIPQIQKLSLLREITNLRK